MEYLNNSSLLEIFINHVLTPTTKWYAERKYRHLLRVVKSTLFHINVPKIIGRCSLNSFNCMPSTGLEILQSTLFSHESIFPLSPSFLVMFVVFISILPILINLIPKPLNAYFFVILTPKRGTDATVPPSVGSLIVLMLHLFTPHHSIHSV